MAAIATAQTYRRAPFGPNDPLFHRCLMVSSALGLGFLLAVLLWPARRQAPPLAVEQLPPRIARLILEKPKAAAPGPPAQATIEQPAAPEAPAQVETPKPVAPPPPRARRAEPARRIAPDVGQVGRARATQEVATIERSTEALNRSLENLNTALASTSPTAATSAPAGRRRSRGVSAGRSGAEVGSVATGVAGTGALVDLGGSTIAGSRISIGELGGVKGGTGGGGIEGGSGTSGGTGGGTGALPGVYRSNASLLAVIQKYAAGIQYCYGNELKRDPSLKGKLVVALTVSASGAVTEATIVEDTVRSPRLASCALSQIREWKFPAISGGATSFQTPFVFTPPN